MTTLEIQFNAHGFTEAECGNCGEVHDIEALKPIADAQERICAGEEVPAGECPDPECGALCHVVKPEEEAKQFPPVPVSESYEATVTVWCAYSIETEPKKIKLAETQLSESHAERETNLTFEQFVNEHVELYRIYYEFYPDGDITIDVARRVSV